MRNRGSGAWAKLGRRASMAAALTFFVVGAAQAVSIPTGMNDLKVDWNNTFLYNLGVRTDSQDSSIMNSPGYYESDSNYDQGDIITSRFSLTSQLVLKYQPSLTEKYGFMVSGDAWYDPAYSNSHVNVPRGYPNSSYEGNSYSPYTRRYYRGPGVELLDAFVYGHKVIGGVPISMQVGRLTKEWGPGLLLGAQEISVNQQPTNLRKSLAQPGSQISELFLPVGQVDLTANLTHDLSFSLQYFLEYEPNRQSIGGTYFGGPDYLFKGTDFAYLPVPGHPGSFSRLNNAGYDEPSNTDHPEFGMMVHWTPQALNTDVGFYYRRYNSKQPWVQFAAPTLTQYRSVFPTGVNLFGVSMDRNIGMFDVGAEVSYINNAPLLVSGRIAPNGDGPRGKVWNVALNATALTGGTALYDTSTILAEIGYQHLDSVSKGAKYYNGDGYATCVNPGTGQPGNRFDGCGTDDSVQAAFDFTPKWVQVFPAWNLSLPLTVMYTIYGNGVTLAAQSFGVNQGAVTYSAGIQADYRSKYTMTLRYQDSYAHSREYGGVAVGGNGGWFLKDRGRVTLTFKTTF